MGVTGSAVPAREGAPSRLPGLDVLRAVAVLLVIGRHTMFFPPDASWPAPLASAMRVWIRGGWIGVDLFFVLSGFLVSGLLFREYQVHGRLRIGRFLLRRGLKIYPAFYTLIAASVCGIVVRQGCRSIPWREIAAESVFLQNYWAAYWWHTWSLAIEEHFYLLCALLLFALSRRSRGGDPFRAVPWGFVLVATVELVLRIGTALAPGPYQNATHLTPTHLRLDGLSFGVLLSYAYHFHRAWIETRLRGREGALALSGLAMLAPAFAFPLESTPFVYTAGFTLFWMGSGLLVVAVVLRGVPGGAASRGLAWIGGYSYSIYLWHIPVLFVVTELLVRAGISPASMAGVTAYGMASLVFGIAMAKIVEMPVLRLRDRLLPSLAAPLGPAEAPSEAEMAAASAPSAEVRRVG